MIGIVLAGIAALVIGFGLKKVRPLVGGLICGAIYFGVSVCAIGDLAISLTASAGNPDVALLAAVITEALLAAAIGVAAAVVIYLIRKFR